MNWIGHLLGTDGKGYYDFYSGFAQAVGSIALLGGVAAFVHRHNCHVKGCWRLGKARVQGTEWVVCHHHHPDGHATVEKIAGITGNSL